MVHTMTSRERLLAAIHHQEGDRVPVSPRATNFLREYYGCACWLHVLKAAQEFDFDPIIILDPIMSHVPEFRQSHIPLHNYVKSWLRLIPTSITSKSSSISNANQTSPSSRARYIPRPERSPMPSSSPSRQRLWFLARPIILGAHDQRQGGSGEAALPVPET